MLGNAANDRRFPDWLCDGWEPNGTWFAYFLEEFKKAATEKHQAQLLDCLRRLFV
ncbi:MAG TPA: hypothetical protein VH079_12120 [Terriglobales bacterium]|nr:hypothetical protein [Terriglobales bacterium]